MRILFVGDEASLPSALEEFISGHEDDWTACRVTDGHAAMDAVAASPIDVVVAAPYLADFDTTTLLGQVRTLRPDTLRIALIDAEQGRRPPPARLIGIAHRFLPSPLAPELLIEAVASLGELRERLDSAPLRDAIGRVEKLPSPPHLYLSLTRALERDDDADSTDVARLVGADPAIAAKVLQLSNSAFYTNGRVVADLRGAVTRLGLATLRDLVLASEVFSTPVLSAAERNALQRRALLAARLAARLLPESSAGLGATAALLADIGLLLPVVRNEREPADADDARPGHAEAGAYLLGLWGLPMPIIEAVAFHRRPAHGGSRTFWITGAVHVAMALITGDAIDEAWLARVGVLQQLPEWREQANALMGVSNVEG